MKLEGLVASPGIATGKAVLFHSSVMTEILESTQDTEWEKTRLHEAARTATEELVRLQDKVRHTMGVDYAGIFRSQQTIAEDASIIGEVEALIDSARFSAETALQRVFQKYAALFEDLPDGDYNKTRATDVDDVAKRILRVLLGIPGVDLSDLPRSTILVAHDLFPSDTITLDARRVNGIITERGGPSSHVAILAKNLGIPAAVGVSAALQRIKNRDVVVVDSAHAVRARVLVNPGKASMQKVEVQQSRLRDRAEHMRTFRGLPSVTPDGVEHILSVNVGSTADLAKARESGVRSIGLYRTEFLFLGVPRLPDEETQLTAYRAAAETFPDGFVVIRTLDVGGDKTIPTVSSPPEENPFLGSRGLRFTLNRPDLFRTQLRAILRAGAWGPVKMMFPMVGGVPELEDALALLSSVKDDLAREELPHDPTMEVGIMMEVPSAIWVADALARRVDFFSIGTNDLTQYLLAADRMNSDVSSYYRVYDPAVFTAVHQAAEAARRHGRWIGVCGELGGDPRAIPALIGLGVRELSMSAGLVAEANWIIRDTRISEARKLAREILTAETHREVADMLDQIYRRRVEDLDRQHEESHL